MGKTIYLNPDGATKVTATLLEKALSTPEALKYFEDEKTSVRVGKNIALAYLECVNTLATKQNTPVASN